MFYNTALGNCYYLPKRVSLFLFYGGFECKENLAINPFNKGFYVNPEKLIQFFSEIQFFVSWARPYYWKTHPDGLCHATEFVKYYFSTKGFISLRNFA